MATLIAMSPSCIIALLQPDARNFLSSLFNTSMAFFLFSYQAHEKSILLPLLPITLLNAEYGYLSVWLITTASFSMVPLLWKDGLVLAYTVLQIGSILFYLKYDAIRKSALFYVSNIIYTLLIADNNILLSCIYLPWPPSTSCTLQSHHLSAILTSSHSPSHRIRSWFSSCHFCS